MARIFKNVSPFGELIVGGKRVPFGEVFETSDEATAVGLAEQPLNWLEVEAEKPKPTAKKQ